MKGRVLGIYREVEHSPGKVAADQAIMDSVLMRLADMNFSIARLPANRMGEVEPGSVDLVLAMCKNTRALQQLAAFERAGALVINSALSIRNSCRDLLDAGLRRQGVPIPPGTLVRTDASLDRGEFARLSFEHGVFIKPADPEALASHAVAKAGGIDDLRKALASFAENGLRQAYVQQGVPGTEIKFYGVSGGQYFATVPELLETSPTFERALRHAAFKAAEVLGLEVWGGDAIVNQRGFSIIDFNAWPSFAAVRDLGALAIARHCAALLERSGRRPGASRN